MTKSGNAVSSAILKSNRTLTDIAQKCGVSVALLSRWIGDNGYVPADQSARIIATELGINFDGLRVLLERDRHARAIAKIQRRYAHVLESESENEPP